MKTFHIKYIITSLFLIFSALCSKAELVEQADSAYKSGDYNRAIESYRTIEQNEGVSSNLYYNMGNAYAKTGDYGHALLFYLKALRLDPSNKSARENIAYIESKVYESNQSELRGKKFSLDADSPSFLESTRLFITRDHLSDTWAIWAAVCFCLFIVCVAMYIFTGNVLLRKIGFFGGGSLLFLSALFLIFSFMAAGYKSDEGVIISPKVKLRSEASLASKESPVNLTRGTRMTILDETGDDANSKWYKVRLNSDFVGWIQDNDFEGVGI